MTASAPYIAKKACEILEVHFDILRDREHRPKGVLEYDADSQTQSCNFNNILKKKSRLPSFARRM